MINGRNWNLWIFCNFIRGADVAKWIKAVDCESTMRGFNSRRSPINKWTICYA